MGITAFFMLHQEEPFYYHSDHLGGASWITDTNGQPVQHLQYLPFGESFVNQHTSGYGNNENGCFWILQGYSEMEKKDGAATHKAPPRAPLELVTSTGFDREKDSLRLNPQSEGLCGARLTSPLDLFTRFYYFGARYYDCDLSGLFLSVDPMSDKYPNLSPYNYCAWNPVKLVDPDGEKIDLSDLTNEQKNNIIQE